MAATLVQSKLCGNGSGTFTSGAGGVTSATGSFAIATTPGNFLVLITSNVQNVTSGSGFEPSTITVTTPGITWVSALNCSPGDIGTVRSQSALFYLSNAPSVPSSSTITVTYNILSGGLANGNMSIEFAVYEFTGVSQATSIGIPGPLIDQEGTNNSQAGGNPTVSMTTTNSDLIIAFFRGNSANGSAPAGYNLGQSMSLVTVAQMAWNGNVAAGAQTITFSGAQTNWGAAAIALRFGPSFTFHRNWMDDLPIWCHSYTAPEGKDKFRG